MKKIHTQARKSNRGHRWYDRERHNELLAYRAFMKKIDRGLHYLGLKGSSW